MTDAATNAAVPHSVGTVVEIPEMLSTTGAMKMLGVTRTGLMKLVRSRQLVSVMVGTHERFRAADVLALRDRQQ